MSTLDEQATITANPCKQRTSAGTPGGFSISQRCSRPTTLLAHTPRASYPWPQGNTATPRSDSCKTGGDVITELPERNNSSDFSEEDYTPKELLEDIYTGSFYNEDDIFCDQKEIIDELCSIDDFDAEFVLEDAEKCLEFSEFLADFQNETFLSNETISDGHLCLNKDTYKHQTRDCCKEVATQSADATKFPCAYHPNKTINYQRSRSPATISHRRTSSSLHQHQRQSQNQQHCLARESTSTTATNSSGTSTPPASDKLPSYEEHMFQQFQQIVTGGSIKPDVVDSTTFTVPVSSGHAGGCYVPTFHPAHHPSYYQHYLTQYNCQRCEQHGNSKYTALQIGKLNKLLSLSYCLRLLNLMLTLKTR